MKLLLSSNGKFALEQIPLILGKPASSISLVRITTASKGKQNLDYFHRHTQQMEEMGYDFQDVDIEGRSKNELDSLLKGNDAVYVDGGNTFYLLRAVRASGFDEVVRRRVMDGLFYVGSSAGAYLACPTIEMATWRHQDLDRFGVTDFTALNLVPFLVTAHYKPEYEQIIREEIPQSKYPVRILIDGQGLLVEDGNVTLVGDGQETTIH